MPGLVFVCSPGRAPWVYAATERPADAEQQLFRMPAFNVFGDGRVCPGSHRFPEQVDLTTNTPFHGCTQESVVWLRPTEAADWNVRVSDHALPGRRNNPTLQHPIVTTSCTVAGKTQLILSRWGT